MVERIPIIDISPVVERGHYPVKAVVGEAVRIEATVFREGHDALGAGVVLKGPRGRSRPLTRLLPTSEPDIFAAWVIPDRPGAWTFRIESWSDPYASWRHAAEIKIEAGIDVELMLAEGVLVLERALQAMPAKAPARRRLSAAIATAARHRHVGLGTVERPDEQRGRRRTRRLPATGPGLADGSLSAVRRPRARPRRGHGTSSSRAPKARPTTRRPTGGPPAPWRQPPQRLDAIAEMGFDVVYLPPVHPIGEVNRKGPNNTLNTRPGDPGSTWAIGSHLGGHDAIRPGAGYLRRLRRVRGPGAASSGSRWRSTWPCSAPLTIPG